jgi:hypothetical protein
MCMVHLVNPDLAFDCHVSDSHTCHARGHPEHGGYLRH